MSIPLVSSSAQAAQTAASDLIKDGTLASFAADVLTASQKVLVLVDLWATWCGPCKQLGPALEKIVREQKGVVKLVKIDVDRNQTIAQQLGVQSIPAVFAFYKGRPVDAFAGALPEGEIRKWLAQILKLIGAPMVEGDEIAESLADAEALYASGHTADAERIYQAVLNEEPENAIAFAGFLRCLHGRGAYDEAEKILAAAPPKLANDPKLSSIKAALALVKETATASGSRDSLLAALSKNPDDLQVRYDLALAEIAESRHAEAIDHLLEIIRRNRSWNEEAARKQVLKIFDALGWKDPMAVDGRKRLSTILFS